MRSLYFMVDRHSSFVMQSMLYDLGYQRKYDDNSKRPTFLDSPIIVVRSDGIFDSYYHVDLCPRGITMIDMSLYTISQLTALLTELKTPSIRLQYGADVTILKDYIMVDKLRITAQELEQIYQTFKEHR